ncbi:hypothetical protein OUZ56_001540 [Daphnia magna]|uniref:Uncharacterized protein n=1 Tax=Daphnia magna TaxID=35525 RepID=A0ABR0A3I7_9CRUS|nr:hypothetical protein OUZ56_001540 [Daphnia magna]
MIFSSVSAGKVIYITNERSSIGFPPAIVIACVRVFVRAEWHQQQRKRQDTEIRKILDMGDVRKLFLPNNSLRNKNKSANNTEDL